MSVRVEISGPKHMKENLEYLKKTLIKAFEMYDTTINISESRGFSMSAQFPPNDSYCKVIFSAIYQRFAKKNESNIKVD